METIKNIRGKIQQVWWSVRHFFSSSIYRDKILSNGRYWIVIVIITFCFLVILSSVLGCVHNFKESHILNSCCIRELDNRQRDLDYDPLYDAVGYFLGYEDTIDELKDNKWLLVFCAIIKECLIKGVVLATIIGLFSNRREAVIKGDVRYSKRVLKRTKYAVVIGANEVAAPVIRCLLNCESYGLKRHRKNDNEYIILQTSNNADEVRRVLASHLTPQELDKVIVYNASRDSIDEIRKLHLELATEIYILGENTTWDGTEAYHDSMNIRCLNLIASILKDYKNNTQEDIGRVLCRVLFEYQTTSSVFHHSNIADDVNRYVNFIPINRYELCARRVLVDHVAYELMDCDHPHLDDMIEYIPLDGYEGIKFDDDKHVHMVIVGMSKMGVAMGVQTMLQAHYPNFRSQDDQPIRTRITFIDTNADKEMDFFKGRYANLFELMRHRYLDASTCDEGNFDSDYTWVDPMKESDCPWKHLAENDKNFIDLEVEFIKGTLESDGVRKYLCHMSTDQSAKLTIAICLTQTHQAIAAALYMPLVVYTNEHLNQILVYQREVSDIIKNLIGEKKNDIRYEKLRPFGMLFSEQIMDDKTRYLKAMLVNSAYSMMKKQLLWPLNVDDKENDLGAIIVRNYWRELDVATQISNKLFVDSIYQKLRSVMIYKGDKFRGGCNNGLFKDSQAIEYIEKVIAKNAVHLAICEHNRWNVEKLMMGYSMITEKENKMLIEFVQMRKKYDPKNEVTKLKYDEYNAKHKKMKADLKTGYRKAHPNICDYLHLDKADPGAKNYDEILNAAIPYILTIVDGYKMPAHEEYLKKELPRYMSFELDDVMKKYTIERL